MHTPLPVTTFRRTRARPTTLPATTLRRCGTATTFVVATWLFATGGAWAQDPLVNDLQAPSSPAFTILGVQPSEITKPKAYKALEASVLTNFGSSGRLQVPSSYAVEFTPYWFRSRPKVTFDQLMNPGAAVVKQTFSVSLATAERPDRVNANQRIRQFAVGARATLFPGELRSTAQELRRSLDVPFAALAFYAQLISSLEDEGIANYTDLETRLNRAIDARLAQLRRSNESPKVIAAIEQMRLEVIERKMLVYRPSNARQVQLVLADMLRDVQAFSEKPLSELAGQIEASYFERVGFRLDAASALVLDFPTNNFNVSNVAKYGFWLTPSYAPRTGSWEVLGVARFIRNEIPTTATSNVDFGLRGIYNWNNFAVSLEYLYRTQRVRLSRQSAGPVTTITVSTEQDNRFALNLQYRLSERLVLAYALGRNFSLNTEFNGNLISLLSLNFGVNGPRVEF